MPHTHTHSHSSLCSHPFSVASIDVIVLFVLLTHNDVSRGSFTLLILGAENNGTPNKSDYTTFKFAFTADTRYSSIYVAHVFDARY